MEFTVEGFLEQLACITAFHLADAVEVINVSESGDAPNTLPVLQVRAKCAIPRGTMKIYPQGGLCLSLSAVSQREKVEAQLKSLLHVYMKAVEVTVWAGKRTYDADPVRSIFVIVLRLPRQRSRET